LRHDDSWIYGHIPISENRYLKKRSKSALFFRDRVHCAPARGPSLFALLEIFLSRHLRARAVHLDYAPMFSPTTLSAKSRDGAFITTTGFRSNPQSPTITPRFISRAQQSSAICSEKLLLPPVATALPCQPTRDHFEIARFQRVS
jgi:hypothetical protein